MDLDKVSDELDLELAKNAEMMERIAKLRQRKKVLAEEAELRNKEEALEKQKLALKTKEENLKRSRDDEEWTSFEVSYRKYYGVAPPPVSKEPIPGTPEVKKRAKYTTDFLEKFDSIQQDVLVLQRRDLRKLMVLTGDSIPAWKRDERLMPMVYDLIYKKWGFKIDGREINNILRDGEKTIRVEWEHVGKGTHFRQILKAKETDKQTYKDCNLSAQIALTKTDQYIEDEAKKMLIRRNIENYYVDFIEGYVVLKKADGTFHMRKPSDLDKFKKEQIKLGD